MRCCLGIALLLALASTAPCQSKPYAPAVNPSSENVASFTIEVTTPAARAEARAATKDQPEIKLINGKALMHLTPEFNARSIAAPQSTLLLLHFPASTGAVGYSIYPPGIVETLPGLYSRPDNVIGVLRCIKPGKATISVKGFSARAKAISRLFAEQSGAWSGYSIVGGPFSSISGSWTVPTAFGDAGDHSMAWIGIDGARGVSDTVIQVGTGSDYSSGWLSTGLFGGPSYYAWWETFPDNDAQVLSNPVQPGDKMTAIISASGDPQPGSPMTWLIFLMNETQNWTFTQNVTYSGQLKTAEWIVEAPGECTLWVFCSITDLADYGSVSFDAFDFVNSNSPSLSSGDSVTMVQGGKTVSTPSDPDGDRDGFTVMFGDQKPFPPGPLISTGSLPDAFTNFPYQAQFFATGAPAFQWTSPDLPSWLTLNPGTGVIAGTPVDAGIFPLHMVARDATNQHVSSEMRPFHVSVSARPPPPDFSLSASPTEVHLMSTPGGCIGSSTITVNSLFGFSDAVQLSASGAGVTSAQFSPSSTHSTSHLTMHSTLCHGNLDDHFVAITGSSGSLTHSVVIDLVPRIVVGPCDTPQGAHLKFCNPAP